MRLVFTPFSMILGLVAGMIAKKVFDRIWGAIDDEEPPKPEHRQFQWPKMIGALLIEGAIYSLVKGLTDHFSRRSFAKVTGAWPGEEYPDPE